MNIEEIDKWLDNEYGCSFTKLEELHDFYVKKYCDLQQENQQLKDNWNKLKDWLNTFHKLSEFEQWEIVNKMQEIEQGSDSNEI